MNQNVIIPLSLLNQMIALLGRWNLSAYPPAIRQDHDNILFALIVKKRKLELRDAYAEIMRAHNQEAQDEARIRYLQQKRELADIINPPF